MGISLERWNENWRMLGYDQTSSFNSSEKQPQKSTCLKERPSLPQGLLYLFLFFILMVMAHECFHIMHQLLLQSSTGRNKTSNSTSTHSFWEWLFPKNCWEGIISQPRKTNELQFVWHFYGLFSVSV